LAAGRCLPVAEGDLTVAELAARYLRFAKTYYRKDGAPTGSMDRIKAALRLLKESYAHTFVQDFGPLCLQAIQHKLAASGRCRRYCNYLIDTVRRVFKWGVAQELLPESVYRALTTVNGLRKGRSAAPDRDAVPPVSDAVVDATLPYLPPIVADMVRLHRLIGARPAEVCLLRPADIDTTAAVWAYTPGRHKTEHHGHTRIIFIGPKAQDILRPYLLRPAESYCFVPAEGERKRRAEVHAQRVTPLSYGNRPGSNRRRKPRRSPGDQYETHSYYYAVRRAVEKANAAAVKAAQDAGTDPDEAPRLPVWTPNQLRHTAATEIRRAFGLEAVQAVLGHKNMTVSEVYAEKNQALAAEVARKIG